MGDAGHAGSPPLLQALILSQPAPPRGLRHRAASTGPRRPRAASDALELAGQTEVWAPQRPRMAGKSRWPRPLLRTSGPRFTPAVRVHTRTAQIGASSPV